MAGIISGNLGKFAEVTPERRGWFLGHFVEKESRFHCDDFEVKWGVHPRGWKKSAVGMNIRAKTISILISGNFKVIFPKGGKEVVLEKAGDFVFLAAMVHHSSEALEDSIVLTIRWPSIANDQPKRIYQGFSDPSF
ncbi:MAG: signal peptidase I [Candidatus Woesearchaeota archaeon]